MKNFLTEEQINIFLDALEKKIGRKLVFVDMDGCIAHFDNAAEIWAKKEGINSKEFIDRKLYRQPKFYAGLELIDNAKEAVEKLSEIYEIRFLSAPSWGNPHSFIEKRIWIEEKFGDFATKRMDLTFRKDLSMGHFLIDDRLKYGAGDFIGEHIMYGSEQFPDWNSVLKYLL